MFNELITDLLQDGYKVSFSASGHSMYPTIMANETIMVEPVDPGRVKLGDILLYRSNGRLVAHRVIGISLLSDSGYLSKEKFDTLSSTKQFIQGDSPLIKHSAPQVKRS